MSHRRTRQQGNIIIIAVFVMIVMGLLATNLIRVKWSNQDTLTRENLGTQAWFLASSANEWALTKMYPLNGSGTLSDLTTNCDAINVDSSAVSDLASGLPCNEPVVTCRAPESALPDELKYFQISSSAICSSGTVFQVQRQQEVWIKVLEE